MEELIRLWLPPVYVAMLGLITLTLKLIVVPFIKSTAAQDMNPKGYTPVIIAIIGGIVLAFLWKLVFPFGAWAVQEIALTALVGIFAAFSAIGLNVTTQAFKGNDVSIGK